jgi:hypothetical protein
MNPELVLTGKYAQLHQTLMNNGYFVEIYYRIIGREDTPVAAEFFLERTR